LNIENIKISGQYRPVAGEGVGPVGDPHKSGQVRFLLRPNGCMDQDGTTEVGLDPDNIVLDGDPTPHSPKRGPSPLSNFRPLSIVAKRLDTSRCRLEVGLSPGDFVLDGDPSSLPKKGRSPQFSAHVYCGQTAAWIKMPLGTRPMRHCIRWGPSSPPLKGHSPQFSANVRCG